ncbi:hypothetical protein AX14_005944, partial [Amanita brunnescens Koide BX004]
MPAVPSLPPPAQVPSQRPPAKPDELLPLPDDKALELPRDGLFLVATVLLTDAVMLPALPPPPIPALAIITPMPVLPLRAAPL